MSVRRSVPRAVAAGAVVAAVLSGTAVAVAAASSSSGPTGLCLSPNAPVTSAAADGNGGFTCAAGRTLVVLASEADALRVRESVADLYARMHGLQDQVWDLGSVLDLQGEDLQGLRDRVGGTEYSLFGVRQDLARAQEELTDMRNALGVAESALNGLQRSTAVSRVSEAVVVDGSATRTLSCGEGVALSGSSRDDGTRVVSSSITEDGQGWTFLLEAPAGSGTATLTVVCAGRPVSPTAGGGGGSGSAAPDGPSTGTPGSAPGTAPAPGPAPAPEPAPAPDSAPVEP